MIPQEKHASYIVPSDNSNYLVRWDLDADPEKAYPDDQYVSEDLQVIDFRRRLKLPYPMDEKDNPVGRTFNLWMGSFRRE